jgi:peptidoglycan/LPS O-acetylase OafA/YrhL
MRSSQVDIIKGLAIISVIILHSLSTPIKLSIGAPFYIWQAVPIFIIIAGYNGAMSCYAKGSIKLRQCYNWSMLSRRFHRILVPFFWIWILQQIIIVAFLGQSPCLLDLAKSLISGGQGAGTYFIPVILQHILILPALFWIGMRSPTLLLFSALFLNLCFEAVSVLSGMTEPIYKYIYARFLFAGALGVWLVVTQNRPKICIGICTFVSLIYIAAVGYFGLSLPFIHPSWGIQNAPSYMWPFTMILLGLTFLPSTTTGFLSMIIAGLGRASYHIFLVQMTFFWIKMYPVLLIGELPDKIASLIRLICCLSDPNSYNIIIVISNILICTLLGLIFYSLANRLALARGSVEKKDLKQKII